MKITLDSGSEIKVTNGKEQAQVLEALFKILGVEKSGDKTESTTKVRRTFRKILGARRWTEVEDSRLKDYPRLLSSTMKQLAQQLGRTPQAIYQRHYVLVKKQKF